MSTGYQNYSDDPAGQTAPGPAYGGSYQDQHATAGPTDYSAGAPAYQAEDDYNPVSVRSILRYIELVCFVSFILSLAKGTADVRTLSFLLAVVRLDRLRRDCVREELRQAGSS